MATTQDNMSAALALGGHFNHVAWKFRKLEHACGRGTTQSGFDELEKQWKDQQPVIKRLGRYLSCCKCNGPIIDEDRGATEYNGDDVVAVYCERCADQMGVEN